MFLERLARLVPSVDYFFVFLIDKIVWKRQQRLRIPLEQCLKLFDWYGRYDCLLNWIRLRWRSHPAFALWYWCLSLHFWSCQHSLGTFLRKELSYLCAASRAFSFSRFDLPTIGGTHDADDAGDEAEAHEKAEGDFCAEFEADYSSM